MNKNVFGTTKAGYVAANTVNEAGGKAYKLSAKEGLAQLAATGCLNNTYYADADKQLDQFLGFAKEVAPEFVAKVAVYARESGFMKDMPVVLLAYLLTQDKDLFEAAFPRVVNNGKQLRNFVQVMRSGKIGRTSLGTVAKRAVRNWFRDSTGDYIFRNSIGNDPSMADVIKMMHPRPQTDEQDALFAYMIGKDHQFSSLPLIVQQFEHFKKNPAPTELPNLPFQFLAPLDLTVEGWTALALASNWTTLRMNLNTFARHGVFKDKNVVRTLATKLADPNEVRRAKIFPYQLMAAYIATQSNADVPVELTNALQEALETAVENIPRFAPRVHVLVDVSGSMMHPVTGARGTATTAMSCVQVASMMASSILRNNKTAQLVPFNTRAVPYKINPFDSVMTNAVNLSKIVEGGTACSAGVKAVNDGSRSEGDVIIMISDNESWFDNGGGYSSQTATKGEWDSFKKHHKGAKMICINLAPYGTAQAPTDKDVMNIGGFSDAVFDVIANFVEAKTGATYWVNEIERSVEL